MTYRFLIEYLVTLGRSRIDRLRAREDSSLGASAVEWVVISALLVAIAIAIGGAIKLALDTKTSKISSDISGAGG